MICLHMSVTCHSICKEKQFEMDEKKCLSFLDFHWENSCRYFKEREGGDNGKVKKQINKLKQQQTKAVSVEQKTRQKLCSQITHFCKFLCPYRTTIRFTSGKRQKFVKPKKKKFIKKNEVSVLRWCSMHEQVFILCRIARQSNSSHNLMVSETLRPFKPSVKARKA